MKKRIVIILLFVSSVLTAQKKLSFSDVTENTEKITTKYFNDYIKLNFEEMKLQAHQNISFNDPTAKSIFGIDKIEGKDNVFKNFKKTYASIVEMKSKLVRAIFSSNVGVFEIELTYKFKGNKDKVLTISKMPLIIMLTIKDSKIIEHVDYGDYNHFLKEYKRQLSQ